MRQLPQEYKTKASGDQNAPVELYDVYLDTTTLHLVKYDKNMDFFDLDGVAQTYIAFPLTRYPAEHGTDLSVGSVTIRVANVDRSMSAYIADNDFRGRRVVIRKIFTDLVSDSGDAVIVFDGLMDGPVVSEDVLEFTATDRLTLQKEIPRDRYQLLCNWKFGNPECFFGRTSGDMFRTADSTVTSNPYSQRIITPVAASGSGFWRDGSLEIMSGPELGRVRKIQGSTPSGALSFLTLDYGFDTFPLDAGTQIRVRRTCDKTWFRCSGDFQNDKNFLGFPTIPQELVVR